MHEMKRQHILQTVALLLLVAGCRTPTATGWKTVVDEDGNVTLMDPMMQDFLASQEPNPTQESLDSMLKHTTRIRVMSAGMSGSELLVMSTNEHAEAEVLLDTTDESQVAAFRNLFKIVEDADTFGHCMCLGWPTIEFYSGDRLISRIGMHHGRSIRWAKWKWDAGLTHSVALLDWLAANEAPQPKKSYDADLARAAEQRRKYQRWLDAVPSSTRARWDEINWQVSPPFEPTRGTVDDLVTIMTKATPDPQQRALLLFEWYGHGEGQWNGAPMRELVPSLMLVGMDIHSLLKAAQEPGLTEAQLEGVSRFFCFGGSSALGHWAARHTEYRDVLKASEELKERIRKHVLQQKDDDKQYWMENSLLFKGGIEPEN